MCLLFWCFCAATEQPEESLDELKEHDKNYSYPDYIIVILILFLSSPYLPMYSSSLTLLLFILSPAVSANSTQGLPCNVGNSRLQIGTYQFWDECDSLTYCSAQAICEPMGCRKDEFPFGFPRNSNFPPKCPTGQFCPDEGSSCQALLAVGSPCQLNRDDQCQAPPNFQELADTSGRGLNSNGSVCLNNVCMWANATLNSPCVIENTPFIVYSAIGEAIDIVSRGNCQLGLYCDTTQKVCLSTKANGDSCAADKECNSLNCLSTGVCGISSSSPRQFGAWVYVLVAFGIIGGMGGVLAFLYHTHKKHRTAERAKREQYWREQNAFHQNLMKMRETAARMSLVSLAQENKGPSEDAYSTVLEEPKARPRARNLKESRRDFDERLARLSRRFDPGRF